MKNSEFKNKIFQLKILIQGSNPEVWRRVEVPTTMSLRGLHRLIQKIFLWRNYHLYVYEVDGLEYGDPELEEGEFGWCDDQSKKLFQICKKTKQFKYIYDFGDNWVHLIEIEKLLEPKMGIKYPQCIDGANGPIPEDCGGIHRYNERSNLKEELHGLAAPEFFRHFNINDINEFMIERRRVIRESSY